MPINLEKYPQYFKYQIYDAYRPKTLAHAREYLTFLTTSQANPPQHILEYLNQDLKTKIPQHVN